MSAAATCSEISQKEAVGRGMFPGQAEPFFEPRLVVGSREAFFLLVFSLKVMFSWDGCCQRHIGPGLAIA